MTAKRRPSARCLPQRLSRRTIYRNPWVSLHVDRVRYPNGRIVPAHHVIDFPAAASAAIVSDAKDRVLFVRAYRYVTGRAQWELPAGRSDPGESALVTARREVREETGFETHGHRLLYSFHPANGVSNLTFHLVSCKAGRRTGTLDLGEVNAVSWFDWERIRRMIRQRAFRDGFTLAGLLLALHQRSR